MSLIKIPPCTKIQLMPLHWDSSKTNLHLNMFYFKINVVLVLL